MPFEVQIRTLEMHRMAEEGVAAHWKYKEGRVGDQKDERYFQWMRQLLEYQQEVRDPQEFIQNLKVELYPEEVYTFTPKGQVKAFPRGATPIDFAYSIHTDVGHQCVGARVNGKMVPLRAHLKNGDIVEIITPGGAQAEPRLAELRRDLARPLQDQAPDPSRGARPRHRSRAQGVREGAAPLRRSAEGHSRRRGIREGARRRRRQDRRRPDRADRLRHAVGQAAARQARAERSLREKPPDGAVTAAVKRAFGGGEEKIKVRGSDDVLVFRARCCNPIRGEKIVGYITRGKGVSVHSATCPERRQSALRPGAAHRGRVGQGAGRRGGRGLHREADDGGRGPEGRARGGQRQDRRHQHEHQEHGGAHRTATISARGST